MKLDGIHHITAITGDAQRNVDFYVGVLGLRLVKKSVNQDDPTVYHLFYGDEHAHPGLDLTFFEYPGAMPGRAGDGMIHRVVWRVASEDALDFWAGRLADHEIEVERLGASLLFSDPEGLGHELLVADVSDEPLIAEHPEIPAEHALQGFHAARAFSSGPERSRGMLDTLGFEPTGDEGWETRGPERSGRFYYDAPPAERGIPGAGTVHHIAWTSEDADHESWRERAQSGGGRPTPVIDRHYFRSIYFREPSGVLFEIASRSPASRSTRSSTTWARSSRSHRSSRDGARTSRRPSGRSRTRAWPPVDKPLEARERLGQVAPPEADPKVLSLVPVDRAGHEQHAGFGGQPVAEILDVQVGGRHSRERDRPGLRTHPFHGVRVALEEVVEQHQVRIDDRA